MSTSSFWDNLLEPGENLLWTGRPVPQFHWRNWQLFGPVPMAAAGLLAAACFIIMAYGAEGDMWLLILPGLLVLIPARATWQQLRVYRATRYALTDRRALFFRIDDQSTKVRAYLRSAHIAPKIRPTAPPSVSFLQVGAKKPQDFGFDYIETADSLHSHLTRAA